jgi:hypothetical protein
VLDRRDVDHVQRHLILPIPKMNPDRELAAVRKIDRKRDDLAVLQ